MLLQAVIPLFSLAGFSQEGQLLLLASVLVFLAVLSTKLGARVGVPSMFLFLILGMVAGPDGLGFTITRLGSAEFIGHLAMTIILLTGGLETDWKESRPVLRQGILLSTLGMFITIFLTGMFIYFGVGRSVGGICATLVGALLLAAVMSSTDSAAVFSVLRSKRLNLRENLGPLLELESGSNDPTAYLMTILLVGLIESGTVTAGSGLMTVVSLFVQLAVGFGIGIGVGYGGRWILRRFKFNSSPLYSILVLSLAFFSNGLASTLYGNGLLALYVTAIILGSMEDFPEKREVLKFFDSITWLAQLAMFLLLGLLARPTTMLPVLVPAILIGLFLMLVARPAGVFLALLPFRKLPARAKVFISWVGIKGAGPILFALYTVVENVEGSAEIFNIVFVIALMSLLVQGMTLSPAARLLKLGMEEDPEVESFGLDLPPEMGMLQDHVVSEEDLTRGATLRDMHLPHGIRVIMVRRSGRFIVPHGSLKLEPEDHLLLVLGDTEEDL